MKLCTFNQAKLAKEIGFDEPCIEWSLTDGTISKSVFGAYEAPYLHQLSDYIREKHGIIAPISASPNWEYWITFINHKGITGWKKIGESPTYDEAQSKGIDAALNIIVNRKK